MKNLWNKLKVFLIKAGFIVSLKLRLYTVWGVITRALFDFRYRNICLTILSPEEYDELVKLATWKADKLLGYIPVDNVRSARRFQKLLKMVKLRAEELRGSKTIDDPIAHAKKEIWPNNMTDCDDYSQFGACVIDRDFAPYYFAVGSYDPVEGKFSGHAVVLTVSKFNKITGEPEGLVIRGNWGKLPEAGCWKNLEDVAVYIASGMRGELVTWGLWKVSRTWPEPLSVVAYGTSEVPNLWTPEHLVKIYNEN